MRYISRTSINERDEEYNIRQVQGPPKTGFDKEGPGAYPVKKEFYKQKEAGEVLSRAISELVEKQDEITELEAVIEGIKTEMKDKIAPIDKRKIEVTSQVNVLGKKAFSLLADSTEKLEAGAAHFRRAEEVLFGIRESFAESVSGKLSPADKYAHMLKFLETKHPEIIKEVDAYIDNIIDGLSELSINPRQVITQKMTKESFRTMVDPMLEWFKSMIVTIRQLSTDTSELELVSENYVDTLESMV
jgi:hypothetical protein